MTMKVKVAGQSSFVTLPSTSSTSATHLRAGILSRLQTSAHSWQPRTVHYHFSILITLHGAVGQLLGVIPSLVMRVSLPRGSLVLSASFSICSSRMYGASDTPESSTGALV